MTCAICGDTEVDEGWVCIECWEKNPEIFDTDVR